MKPGPDTGMPLTVLPDRAIDRLAGRLAEIRIDDPDHHLGATPAVALALDPVRAVPPHHVHVDAAGRGRLTLHLPAETKSVSLIASADAARAGRPPRATLGRPSLLLLAGALAARPRQLAFILRLAFCGNRRGAEIRLLRLLEAIATPAHATLLALRAAEDADERPSWIAEHATWLTRPRLAIRLLGDDPGGRGATRADLAAQTWTDFSVIGDPSTDAAADADLDLALPAGTRLSPDALYHLVRPFAVDAATLAVYCDEDTIEPNGRRRDPVFHPAWNNALAEAGGLAPTALVVRRDILPADFGATDAATQLLAIAEAGGGGQIGHVPRLLVSRPTASPRPRPTLRPAPRLADGDRPAVSVVIPTRDRPDLLAACLNGLFTTTVGIDVEVIVVDNGSVAPATLDLFGRLEADPRVRRVVAPGPFDFPALNAAGIAAAHHEYLLLLNDDVEARSPDWLRAMVAELQDRRVGAVGARLVFPDGTIQHAGITLGAGGCAGHAFAFWRVEDGGDRGLLSLRRDVSAVTAACLLTRRTTWDSIGGMDTERLAVAFNDVDWCLKARARGLRIVWTPAATLLHREQASRGRAETAGTRARRAAEEAVMIDRWGEALMRDPFHSPALSLAGETLLPAIVPRDRTARFVR